MISIDYNQTFKIQFNLAESFLSFWNDLTVLLCRWKSPEWARCPVLLLQSACGDQRKWLGVGEGGENGQQHMSRVLGESWFLPSSNRASDLIRGMRGNVLRLSAPLCSSRLHLSCGEKKQRASRVLSAAFCLSIRQAPRKDTSVPPNSAPPFPDKVCALPVSSRELGAIS